MKLVRKIEIGDSHCYPCYPLIEKQMLYYGVRYSSEDSQLNSCEKFEIQKYDLSVNKILWTLRLDGDLLCRPVLDDKAMIIVTGSSVRAIDKDNGTEIWKMKINSRNSHISLMAKVIYLVNDNTLTRINIETEKKIDSKKYRVKWLDSPVVTHLDRLFVSTSNSKIIEIDGTTLEILNEYKYPGGWAIGSTPVFFNRALISNSYAAYVIGFDIDTTDVIWRVKKQAGTEPRQLLSKGEGDNMFFFCEILGDYKISAIKLPAGKKAWTKEYHVDKLINAGKVITVIAKEKGGQYFIGEIDKENGEFLTKHAPSQFNFDDRFQYRLWNGADLLRFGNYSIVCYSPNEIFIFE